jgi:hypothetical protein
MKWEQASWPPGFFANHKLWIFRNGKVYTRIANGKIHADVWGSDVWNIEERGYYNPDFELVTCHGTMSDTVKRLLARKFKTALFYFDHSLE